jgi:predicted nucleic acid-binding protein
MYLDSAYIAKFYVNEVDSRAVRELIGGADSLVSSAWAMGEVSCVLHRHMRENRLTQRQFRELLDAFLRHVGQDVWTFLPVTYRTLQKVAALVRAAPAGVHLRAGDAVHLAAAMGAEEHEIWTNDRHLLQAAKHFGLSGRSV